MNSPSFFWRCKWFLLLFLLLLADFSPFPVTSLIVMYIFLFRPPWFKNFVERLYS